MNPSASFRQLFQETGEAWARKKSSELPSAVLCLHNPFPALERGHRNSQLQCATSEETWVGKLSFCTTTTKRCVAQGPFWGIPWRHDVTKGRDCNNSASIGVSSLSGGEGWGGDFWNLWGKKTLWEFQQHFLGTGAPFHTEQSWRWVEKWDFLPPLQFLSINERLRGSHSYSWRWRLWNVQKLCCVINLHMSLENRTSLTFLNAGQLDLFILLIALIWNNTHNSPLMNRMSN